VASFTLSDSPPRVWTVPFYDTFRHRIGVFFHEDTPNAPTAEFSLVTFSVDAPLLRELVARQERITRSSKDDTPRTAFLEQEEDEQDKNNTNTATKSTHPQQSATTSKQTIEENEFLYEISLTHRGLTTTVYVSHIDPTAPFIIPKKKKRRAKKSVVVEEEKGVPLPEEFVPWFERAPNFSEISEGALLTQSFELFLDTYRKCVPFFHSILLSSSIIFLFSFITAYS
jgi:hypothetical protein